MLWMVLLGLGQGGALGLALILPVLRGGEPGSVATLTAMTLSVGYLVAALGPWVAGVLHDATGGWTRHARVPARGDRAAARAGPAGVARPAARGRGSYARVMPAHAPPGGMRVALVTCALFPALTDDDRLVAGALAERGAEVLVWDWRRPSPGAADLVVLRSPWNHPEHAAEFDRWLGVRAADGGLVNSVAAVRWNLHKGYLHELSRAGVPCVPTEVVRRGGAADLAALKRARGWGDVVVKPAVGGSSRDTVNEARVGAPAAARHLRELSLREDVVVQPFVDAVLERGELSLVYLGGRFSHAVRKAAAPGDWRVQSDFGGTAEPVEPRRACWRRPRPRWPPHPRACTRGSTSWRPASGR